MTQDRPAQHEVVITGLGPVTSIGTGCDDLWASLRAGRCAVGPRELRVEVDVVRSLSVASMPPAEGVPGLAAHLAFLDSQDCPGHRDLAYAMLAVELALADAGLTGEDDVKDMGCVQAFEAPAVEATVGKLFMMLSQPPPPGPPHVYDFLSPGFYAMQPFLYVHLLGKAFGFHGYSTSVHNACSSGAWAIETAAQHIRSGAARAMVVVGGEAFDTAVRLEWFRRLELYAQAPQMRPFDAQPTGFYVGEGAAAMVLESLESARARGANIHARYAGGAFAHQAWKQTIPDVRAARLQGVIDRALEDSGLSPEGLDFVVPHGAATMLSDGYEAACLKQSLAGAAKRAVVSTFKPSVGHMLAACGLIDTLCALLCMKHGVIPVPPHTRPEHARCPLPLTDGREGHPPTNLLKLFTGFTGHDAALVFDRV